MRKYFKTTIIITIILTAVVVFYINVKLNRLKNPIDNGKVVRLEEVKLGSLQEFVSAPGEIEPKTKVDISAKISSRIIELPFEEGDQVRGEDPDADPPFAGSVLIRLDAKDLTSRLKSAEARYNAEKARMEVTAANIQSRKANLKGTEASLEQAKKDFARQKQLFESKDVSQSTYDQAKQKLDELMAQYQAAKLTIKSEELGLVVAQYNLEASQASIDEAREAVGYTVIHSPIDGIVTRINAEVGEVVMTGTMNNPGTIIMQVADLSKMLLVAQIDESDIGNLEVGQRAEVRVQAYWDERFEGIVDTIALTHDLSRTGAKYYRTEILMQGDVSKLYSGLTADVDIFTKKHEDIIKVPSQAVLGFKVDALPLEIRENNPNVDINKNDVSVVYRVVDGKTVVTPVTIGSSDATHMIIKSGLEVGDKVVIGPYKILGGLGHDQKIRDEKEVEAEKKAKEQEKAKEKESQEKANSEAKEGESKKETDTEDSDN